MANPPLVLHADEQAVIDYGKQHETFTFADLERDLSGSKWRQTNFISRMRRQSVIFVVGQHKNRLRFSLNNPLMSRDDVAQARKTPAGVMWTAMRSIKEFTPDELLAYSKDAVEELTRDDVQTYCTNLVRANYLKVLKTASQGIRPAKYRLVRDTGPLAPTVRRLECVVDGNSDRVAYVAGDRL